MPDTNPKRRRWWRLIVYPLALAAAVAAAWVINAFWYDPPKVVGETAEDRMACVYWLRNTRPMGVTKALLAATDDPAPIVRQAAYISLREFITPAHRPLVEKGLRDSSELARGAAVLLLIRFPDDKAVQTLAAMRREDKHDMVRRNSLEALLQLNPPRMSDLLLEALRDDRFMSVKRIAIKMLDDMLEANKPGASAGWPRDRWQGLKDKVEALRPVILHNIAAECHCTGCMKTPGGWREVARREMEAHDHRHGDEHAPASRPAIDH